MSPEVFRFEDVTVDLRRMSVTRAGHPVSLEPKTFDVLRYLIEHRDRLVTKEELLDAAWKDTFVTPNVLTRAIAQLRKALGDDAFEARFIETVAKRGYRFIAPVVTVAIAPAEQIVAADVTRVSPAARLAPRTAVGAIAGMIVLAAAAGFGFYAMRDRETEPPHETPQAQLSPRRFTTGGASYYSPAITLDGRTIAYASDETGSGEIYTSGFAPGARPIAITSDGGQNTFPAWSPDGQWLAYHSRKKGGIWIVPASGGSPRQIADFGSQPSWTPDGERLIFTSAAGGMAAQSTLWSVNRDGSDRRELTRLGAPRGGHHYPSVSPDGRLVTFGVGDGSSTIEIWTVPIAGGPGVKLGTGSIFSGPRFSHDGRAVYWSARTPEGNDALMCMPVDSAGASAGPAQNMMTVPGNLLGGLSIARDGTAVLLMYRATANLFAVDVPAEGLAEAPIQLTSEDARLTAPRHFRDGHIVFTQMAAGQPVSTWLMDENSGKREALTVGFSDSVGYGQWSSDGQRVFVISGSPRQPKFFAWLDVATRKLTRIPVSVDGVLSPSLSRDARELAFHLIDERGVLNVWTQSLDGGPRKQVTFDKEAMSYPVWSPDGRSIAIEIKRGDDTFIGVVPRNGGSVEMVVLDRGHSWPHSWTPDGQNIVFAGSRGGIWNIYTVSTKTKVVRQLTAFTEVAGYVRYPSWSFTRPRVVFERAAHTGTLWTVKLR